MTDAEKIRRAIEEDTYIGDMTPLLAAEVKRLRAENLRLRDKIDLIVAPPMTIAEAEKAYADAESIPLDKATIDRMVAYVTNPANMSAEVALDRMIKAARQSVYFNPVVLEEAEACLRRC